MGRLTKELVNLPKTDHWIEESNKKSKWKDNQNLNANKSSHIEVWFKYHTNLNNIAVEEMNT